MYGLLRWLLFRLDPERAHELGLAYLARIQSSPRWRARIASRRKDPDPRLATSLMGLQVPAPLGLAAGFDKGARAYNALLALGFGHVEVGTVTPEGQPGNPRPRIERYPDHRALVNRLGFNNPGVQVVLDRLADHPPEGLVGVNVGRNKDTPPEQAVSDYAKAASALAPQAAYVTVNVSSPNTPGLRGLQAPKQVARLIGEVLTGLDDAEARRPVLLKLHPDAPAEELVEVARAAVDAGAQGIVAVNTTTKRPEGLEHAGKGGLSGAPLREPALTLTRDLYHGLRGEVPIIGVGGITTAQDAIDRIAAGATVVQAYTAFVYEGPSFPTQVHEGITAHLDERGLDTIEELVGTEA